MIFDQFGLLIDIFGAALLVAVIFYVVRLNRNLNVLKSGKAELDALIAAFNDSTNRAEMSVARLKASAMEAASTLQSTVDKAQELRDDLTFMTSRADELATRLEGAISGARRERRNAPSRETENSAQPEGPQASPKGDERGKSKAELLRALQGMR
jgi:chromosome segregation ATPase